MLKGLGKYIYTYIHTYILLLLLCCIYTTPHELGCDTRSSWKCRLLWELFQKFSLLFSIFFVWTSLASCIDTDPILSSVPCGKPCHHLGTGFCVRDHNTLLTHFITMENSTQSCDAIHRTHAVRNSINCSSLLPFYLLRWLRQQVLALTLLLFIQWDERNLDGTAVSGWWICYFQFKIAVKNKRLLPEARFDKRSPFM